MEGRSKKQIVVTQTARFNKAPSPIDYSWQHTNPQRLFPMT